MLRTALGRLPTVKLSPAFSCVNLRAAFSTTTPTVAGEDADMPQERREVPPEDRPFLHHGIRPRFKDYEKFRSPRKRASKLLYELNKETVTQMKESKPAVWETDFRVGDAVELQVVAQGGSKSDNLDKWRGVILGIFKKGIDTSILIRDVVFGEPIERRVPLHSPLVKSLKVLERNFVFKGKKRIKRAKLYYLSDRNPLRKFICRGTVDASVFDCPLTHIKTISLNGSHPGHWKQMEKLAIYRTNDISFLYLQRRLAGTDRLHFFHGFFFLFNSIHRQTRSFVVRSMVVMMSGNMFMVDVFVSDVVVVLARFLGWVRDMMCIRLDANCFRSR